MGRATGAATSRAVLAMKALSHGSSVQIRLMTVTNTFQNIRWKGGGSLSQMTLRCLQGMHNFPRRCSRVACRHHPVTSATWRVAAACCGSWALRV